MSGGDGRCDGVGRDFHQSGWQARMVLGHLDYRLAAGV